MPPIDLPRLRAQGQKLSGLICETEAFLAELNSVLDEHMDRATRPGRAAAGEVRWHSRGTPAPVMRVLASAVRLGAREDPEAVRPTLVALWRSGGREERILAAEAFGEIAPLDVYRALDLLHEWLPSLDSPEAADALGTRGAGRILIVDPGAHLHLVRPWLNNESRHVRRFGVMSLLPLAESEAHPMVQDLFALLADGMSAADPDLRRAMVIVLKALAARAPVETAQFLKQQSTSGDRNTVWIVRRAMEALPEG